MKREPVAPAEPQPPTLRVDQAAEQAGVSRRAIYYWMRDGKLPYVQKAKWHRRVLLADVIKVRDTRQEWDRRL